MNLETWYHLLLLPVSWEGEAKTSSSGLQKLRARFRKLHPAGCGQPEASLITMLSQSWQAYMFMTNAAEGKTHPRLLSEKQEN